MKENILKLRKEGKSYNEIKKILGCSLSTISYHCLNYKSDKLVIIDGVNEDITKVVVDLRLDNLTYLEIWEKLKSEIDKE